jgi:chromosome segregation ATPase
VNALRPEALLKSALEKIVYFEARSAQLQRDGESFRLEVSRLEGELAQASQREIELRRLVAELEVRSTRAHREREEAARVAEALRRERAELIGKILEASAIHGSDSEGESSAEAFDLARFIAELRSEVLRDGQGARASTAPAAPVAAAVETPLARLAQQLQEQGRLTVSAAQAQALEGAQPFAGRTEETLFGFSVREL